MTGYTSKRQAASDKLDDDDIQTYQRPWIGLTDEEMQDLWDRYAHMEMMRAIEAKLKEKNFDTR
jgi:hypothetical protein